MFSNVSKFAGAAPIKLAEEAYTSKLLESGIYKAALVSCVFHSEPHDSTELSNRTYSDGSTPKTFIESAYGPVGDVYYRNYIDYEFVTEDQTTVRHRVFLESTSNIGDIPFYKRDRDGNAYIPNRYSPVIAQLAALWVISGEDPKELPADFQITAADLAKLTSIFEEQDFTSVEKGVEGGKYFKMPDIHEQFYIAVAVQHYNGRVGGKEGALTKSNTVKMVYTLDELSVTEVVARAHGAEVTPEKFEKAKALYTPTYFDNNYDPAADTTLRKSSTDKASQTSQKKRVLGGNTVPAASSGIMKFQ